MRNQDQRLQRLLPGNTGIFYASLVLMLCLSCRAGYDIGTHSDEMDMCAYGKANISYYSSAGKDTSFLNPRLPDGGSVGPYLKYYGPAFEYLAAGLNTITGTGQAYEYNKRHMLCQLMGILAILFSGLLARYISGSKQAALWTIWLMFLSPRFFGLTLFDTKDIPFTTGYIASVYFMIRLVSRQESVPRYLVPALILALTFTLGQRLAGIILIAYLFLFAACEYLYRRKEAATGAPVIKQQLLLQTLPVAIIVAFLTVLIWPYLLQDPAMHIPETLNVLQRFPQKIPLTYDGEYIDSLSIPRDYLLRYMLITIPPLILLLIPAAAAWIMVYRRKLVRYRLFLYLVFSSVFPIIYAISQKTALYNGWRHLTFVYPGLVIIAGIGLSSMLAAIPNSKLRLSAAAGILLLLAPATWWTIRNNPYGYCYYNQLSGGFHEAYYNYETDSWQLSVKESIDWMMQNEWKNTGRDSVILATNAYSFSAYYIRKRYPGARVAVTQSSCRDRYGRAWTYGIFSNVFLPPVYLENNFPPAYNTIHVVRCDQMALSVVLKDTERLEYQAAAIARKGNFARAEQLLDRFLAGQHYNPATSLTDYAGLYSIIAYTKAVQGNFAGALIYGEKALAYNPDDYLAFLSMGIGYSGTGNRQKAIAFFTSARDMNKDDIVAGEYLASFRLKPGQ